MFPGQCLKKKKMNRILKEMNANPITFKDQRFKLAPAREAAIIIDLLLCLGSITSFVNRVLAVAKDENLTL